MHMQRLTNVEIEDYTLFARSIFKWKENNCDLGDALILTIHELKGCKGSITFDKKAAANLSFDLFE